MIALADSLQGQPGRTCDPTVQPSLRASCELDSWFTAEVLPHAPYLRRYLHHRFPRFPDHDDIMQETWLRLLRLRQQGTVHAVRALACRIAHNLVIDQLRRQSRSPWIDINRDQACQIPDDRPPVADRVQSRQELELLSRAIALLPSRTAAILQLHGVEGQPPLAVAGHLGIARGTVYVQLARGLRLCTAMLRRHAEGLPMRIPRARRSQRIAESAMDHKIPNLRTSAAEPYVRKSAGLTSLPARVRSPARSPISATLVP